MKGQPMLTRIKKTIRKGCSYHIGGVSLFVQERSAELVVDGHRLPICRDEAAGLLRDYRRIIERARLAVIAALVAIDPDGVWTDEDSRASGYPLLDLENATDCLTNLKREEEQS
jgi:hypothetical protein